MGKSRVEAFSDGVLAVAITLLVLDLHVDTGPGHAAVGHQLREQWPSYAAYAVSFLIVGVIWVNHHALFALLASADRLLMFINIVLLMFVTTIPFTTATLAGTLRDGGADARWGVLLYGVSMEGMSLGFSLMLWHMLRAGLMRYPVPPAEARSTLIRFGLGLVVYPLVAALGLVSRPAMLLAYLALTLYYMFEHTPLLPSQDRDAAEATDGP